MELLVNETWRDIRGYEGYYQVSSRGRIRSVGRSIESGDRWGNRRPTHVPEKIMSLNKNCKSGYLSVCFYKNGQYVRKHVHRLVALAFIPNPNKLPQINHKDENKGNNNVENLEWCDAYYNNTYGTARKRMMDTKSKAVVAFDSAGNIVNEFQSSKDAAKAYGVSRHAIHKNIKTGYFNRKHKVGFKYKDL